MSVYIMLSACAECLSDISDRMNIYSIIMPDISCCNLYRRFFYSYIQLSDVSLYIIYIMSAFCI